MAAIEKIRKEIERRMNDNIKAEEKYRNGLFGSAAKEDYDLLSFLDTIEEDHFRDSTKMIEPLERPYIDANSGLVLDIPELVDKINEIINYINGKEEN